MWLELHIIRSSVPGLTLVSALAGAHNPMGVLSLSPGAR